MTLGYKKLKMEIEELQSFYLRIIQYEFDHINGIIFKDKLVNGKIHPKK